MKLPLWTISIPLIALCSLFQITYDLGEQGKLDSTILREEIYPIARSVNGMITNIKFRLRGPQKPKQKIVVLSADDNSVEHLGRWPWHREVYAHVIYSTFKMGAKYVGIDVVYSEPEERIPADVYELLKQTQPNLIPQVQSFEGDPVFAQVIDKYKERLVLGYTPQAFCQPRYDSEEYCPISNKDLSAQIEESLGKFAYPETIPVSDEQIKKTPLLTMLTSVANIPSYRDAAKHSGFFFVSPDPDGYIRRYPLIITNNKKIYPSMALKLAELAREDSAKFNFTDDARLRTVVFSKTPDHPIPTTRLGYLDMNFRGKAGVFEYVSAWELLQASEKPDSEEAKRVIAAIKDSIVIFGVTALGLLDMRAFPFDSNTPGVEGHATALDNLLSEDALRSATGVHLDWLPLTALIALGLLFAFLFSRMEAIPSLLIFFGFTALVGFIDIRMLFSNNINLPTGFLLIEILLIFAAILAIRYILEEQNKKFIRGAFSRYLAPQVVDLILKDPSKLAIGGERRELSILFSDLRGFTTLSENMDPKTLTQFLNEYLSEMTEIVFKNEGTLDKYIGDAVMAFWGAPVHQNDHAIRAARAALEMQAKLREIAPRFKQKYGVDIAMGVGVNSGVVSVGNMGSDRIFEYTVIGDHVNLASRLEGLTKLYGVGVLAAENTLEAIPAELRGTIHSRVVDIVKVKGKKNATALVELLDKPLDEKTLSNFAEAQTAFRACEWDKAIELFKRGLPDPVCEIFLTRCEQFKKSPPPAGWDGSIEMRTK